jgi:uncharacterized membrane protein YhaH (DUF805 family)
MRTAIFAILFLFFSALIAHVAAGAPSLDAGSGSSVILPISPAPTADLPSTIAPPLADPVANPVAAISDLRQAQRQGWAVLAFAVLVMLTRVGTHFSVTVKSLRWLGRGNAHPVLAACAAVGVAGYNALVLGGSMGAVVFAAVSAMFYSIFPTPRDPSVVTIASV